MFVIAVNGWMNHPTGFTLVDGRATDVHPWSALFANPMFWSEYVHMYFAAYIVCGFLLAGAYAWAFLRGRRGRYERTALGITLSAAAVAAPLQVIVGDWAARDVAAYQPVKLAAMEGLATTTRGAAEHLLGWYNGHAVVWGVEIPRLLSLLAFHNPNAVVKGLEHRAAGRPAAGQRGAVRLPDDGRHRHAARAARPGLPVPAASGAADCRGLVVLWAVVAAGPLSVVALIAGLDHHRGRPAAVDRLRRDAGLPGGHRGERHPGRLRHAVASSYLGLAVVVFWILRRLGRVPLASLDDAGLRRGLADAGLRPVVFILAGMAAYTVLAGADFGAGLWTLLPGGGGPARPRIRDQARHAMGPVWEANHVWLIFVLACAGRRTRWRSARSPRRSPRRC